MLADWLILHAGALGDLVLTIQLALRLPGTYGDAGLHVISRSNPGDLSECQPTITRQAADGLGLHWLYANTDAPPPDALREAVRRRRVLNALDDQHSVVHQHLAALAPAELWSFDPRPRSDNKRHITQQWQTDLEAQGLLVPKCIHQHPTQRCLGIPESLRQRGRDKLHTVGCESDAILIHPGSGGRDKCWPLAQFLNVARQLTQNRQPVCFLIGPVEVEWWTNEQLATLKDEFPVLTIPSPDDLTAMLAAASVVLANDSGPAHLAALLGTRTLVLFGPTRARTWQPLGPRVHVLTGQPEKCPDNWGITPAQVLTLVNSVL